MAKVGPVRYWARMAGRQFSKRILRRDLTLVLPNARAVHLPSNSGFSSVAWVTKGAVDDGFEVLLRQLGEPGTAFFDVGAHFGFYCQFLSDRHAPVVAFEPDERTLPALRKNLENIAGALCVAAAVSDREGELRFAQSASAPQSRLLAEGESAAGETVSVVPVVVLDRVWRELKSPRVGVIKIDTEGHEEAVLHGAKSLIETCRPLLLVEANARTLAAHASWLDSLGYCGLALSVRHHRRRERATIFPMREVGAGFEEGMLLLVPPAARSTAAWKEIEAGRGDFSLAAANWSRP